MQSKIKIAVSILAIVIAVIFIIKNLAKDSSSVGLVVGCESCDKVYRVKTAPYASNFPLECKYCKKKTVYRMLKCDDCGITFYLYPDSSMQCSECGSQNTQQLNEVPK